MMEKEVIVVANPAQYVVSHGLDLRKRRVAAYARVSTDTEDQIHSFNAQIDEYTKKINNNPDWEFVGMYSDEGISGTSLNKRDGLNALLNEARKGNVDLILVKAVSRLGRNTKDVLSIIDELKEKDVEIFFERENLSSLDPKTRMVLTFHSCIAEEESHSDSENVKWAFNKKMREGNWHVATDKLLGYTKDDEGNMIIDESQAEIVRAIFNLYLANKSMNEIIAYLEGNHYLTGAGKEKWHRQNIMIILQNEKYCGDLLLHKTVVTNFLTHKPKDNRDGKYADLYLVKNHHPAIISREVFDLVQTIIKHKKEDRFIRVDSDNPLSTKLYCGNCGKTLIFQSRKDGKDVFVCNINRRQVIKETCSLRPVRLVDINAVCIKAMKEYYSNFNVDELTRITTSLGNASHKQEEINKVNKEIIEAEDKLKAIVTEKLESDLENDDLRLSQEYKETKKHLNELKMKLESLGIEAYDSFISEARSKEIVNAIQNINNDECYLKLVDKVIVNEDNHITIIDNAGINISKEEISKCFKEINELREIKHGFYCSPTTGGVYKYKIVRLEKKIWSNK